MATEGDCQENIEVSPQVGLDIGNKSNQNDRRCKEKLFKSLTPIINFSKPYLLTICEKGERCLDGPTCQVNNYEILD